MQFAVTVPVAREGMVPAATQPVGIPFEDRLYSFAHFVHGVTLLFQAFYIALKGGNGADAFKHSKLP